MSRDLVVVTGATGQVGVELCRHLRAQGKRVRAVALPGDPARARLEHSCAEIVEADVRDQKSLRRAFADAHTVFHLAAVVDTCDRHDSTMWHVNVHGARNAARAARRASVSRFVYFSSIVVFDPDPTHQPLDEERPRLDPATVSPYVRTKVFGERLVRREIDQGLDAVVVHPTVVVGPNETHHVGIVQSLIFDYFAGKLPATFAGGFNLVGADDLVEGAVAAGERGRTGESYILGGHWYEVNELLERARALCGTRIPRMQIPLWMARAGLPVVKAMSRLTRSRALYNAEELRQLCGNQQISSSKAARELGYAPARIDDALKMCHTEWLRLQQR